MWVSIWASATALLLPQPRPPVVRAGGLSRIASGVRACAAAGDEAEAEDRVRETNLMRLQREASEAAPAEVTRLFVGGIPFDMTEADVTRLFDGLALPHEVSPVTEVCLVLGRNGAPRGYGFVELATPAQAKRALSVMDGRAVSYDGRMPTTLQVRVAHHTKVAGQPPPTPLAGRVLWVGNLQFGVRAGQMVDAFAAAAGVEARSVRCSVATDHRGRSRGFGTACFADPASASRARLALDGAELAGRTLTVRVDRRAGVPVSSADRSLVAPAADAIDPGLLAAIEKDLELDLVEEEMDLRQSEGEARRQQEIARHRAYLSTVERQTQKAFDDRGRKKNGANPNALAGKKPRNGAPAASPYRVVVFNLPFEMKASHQAKVLREKLASRPGLGGLKVWVGADRFGRSRGIGLVGAESASEQWKVIEALNGCSLDGRLLEAKEAHHNPTGLPRFQPAWLRGITSNITASLEAKIATVAGVEIELELDPLKKIDREKQGGAW